MVMDGTTFTCASPVDFPIAPAICGLGVAGLPAAAVMSSVDRDAVKPCGDRSIPAITLQLGGQGGADVLTQILGLVLCAGQAKTQTKKPVVLAFQQR